MHRVIREKIFELFIQLRGEGFVMRNNQRGLLEARNDISHGECFARSGHAQKRLMPYAIAKSGREFFNSSRLVAGRRELTFERERHILIVALYQWGSEGTRIYDLRWESMVTNYHALIEASKFVGIGCVLLVIVVGIWWIATFFWGPIDSGDGRCGNDAPPQSHCRSAWLDG